MCKDLITHPVYSLLRAQNSKFWCPRNRLEKIHYLLTCHYLAKQLGLSKFQIKMLFPRDSFDFTQTSLSTLLKPLKPTKNLPELFTKFFFRQLVSYVQADTATVHNWIYDTYQAIAKNILSKRIPIQILNTYFNCDPIVLACYQESLTNTRHYPPHISKDYIVQYNITELEELIQHEQTKPLVSSYLDILNQSKHKHTRLILTELCTLTFKKTPNVGHLDYTAKFIAQYIRTLDMGSQVFVVNNILTNNVYYQQAQRRLFISAEQCRRPLKELAIVLEHYPDILEQFINIELKLLEPQGSNLSRPAHIFRNHPKKLTTETYLILSKLLRNVHKLSSLSPQDWQILAGCKTLHEAIAIHQAYQKT